ncbi:MAG TPA: YetF domain-containing protein [Dehalococcoidia bacterium]|nr:YetF domain-containing protein [Dehalococcoidia bacterium]
MFSLDVNGWSIVARTLIVYVVLLLALRFAGKRELGQMTPFDLVVILLVANAVQNAMVGPDTSLTGGLIAAGVLVGANFGVAQAREHVPWLRRAVEGTPTLLISDGQLVTEHLKREGLDPDEVMMAIREHGVNSLEEVKLAVLETDGSISIVPTDTRTLRTRRHSRFARKGA